ncbi:MAG: heavy metal translocating P-type ATPase [Actinomycetaceae bacterium]|nr:heavy metal translocating P-type ATPase [Actinomycetaceae bacterium]
MQTVVKFFKTYPAVAATLFVGITAGGLELAEVSWVNWYVSAFALVMAAILSWDMVKEIMNGAWGVDLLAITAIVSTVWVGEYWASLIVCLMLSGGEALEDYAGRRARSQLTGLLEGAPTVAHVLDSSGVPTDVDISDVEVGARLLVRPGEVVPVDGILESDFALTEESSLTGEPLPVEHRAGDTLLSGGVNGSDAVIMKATSVAAESQYQQIIELVREAQESQAPVVRLADRIAVPFTLIAFAIAAFAYWMSGDPVRIAEVLVVATPCPLLIAAPVAFLGGMNRSAKEGIIIKDSGTLEALSKIKTVALDKTGTLTFGHPELSRIHVASGIDARELTAMVAAVESHSSHTLAGALVEAAKQLGVEIPQASNVTETTGKGVSGEVNGHLVEVGSSKWLGVEDEAPKVQSGQIVVSARVDGAWAGSFALEDTLRPDAALAVQSFKDYGAEHVMMITGDGEQTAQKMANRVGITEVHSSLLPEQKVQAIKDAVHPIAAVGDGVNDAPVLATADVGIAMGARGSSAASESADVVVMLDDIYRAARSIAIGKRTMQVAMQAVGIGVGLSVVLMLIGATGVMPAVVGAFMQEVVDLACILWALLAARPGKDEKPIDEVLAGNSGKKKGAKRDSFEDLVARV